MEPWFEIFKTGLHTDSTGRTRDWKEDDLDRIVNNYNPEQYEAPIVIGHPRLEAPAYGWIARVKREGKRLLASAKQILPAFAELVNAGRYKKVSIGLADNDSLHHVGFLGAAAPAVPGLADVTFSDDTTANIIESETVPEEATMPEEAAAQGGESDNSFTDILSSFRQDITLIQQKLEQLTEKLAPSATLPESEAAATPENIQAFSDMEKFLDISTDKGQITPAQKTLLDQLCSVYANQQNFSAASSGFALIRQFIDLQPRQPYYRHISSHPSENEASSSDFETARGKIYYAMHQQTNPHII